MRLERFVRGEAGYVHNLAVPGMVYAAFVRSDYAQARLIGIDCTQALKLEGVIRVLCASDLAALLERTPRMPMSNPLMATIDVEPLELLASERVQFVGQAVAVVLATSLAIARQGAALVCVDCIEPVPHNPPPAPVAKLTFGAPMSVEPDANCISVSVSMQQEKLYAFPMEPRAALITFEPSTSNVTAWLGTQAPSRAQTDLAATLGLTTNLVRVIAPDVGGAFGAKASLTPEEHVIALCAKWLAYNTQEKVSVKWTATRSEDFLSSVHGRGATLEGRLHCTREGQLTFLEAHVTSPLGAWQAFSSAVPMNNALRILPGPYALKHVALNAQALTAPVTAVNIYRGAGRPEAAVLMERLIDKAAHTLGKDPLAFRQQNLIASQAFPYRTATGQLLDSGDYLLLTQRCAERFGYAERRAKQVSHDHSKYLLGIGMAIYLEPSGQGWESARVTLHANGEVEVASGSATQGQGHEVSYATLASQALNCAVSNVLVVQGDTLTCPPGIGALASRSTSIGGSAVWEAALEVAARRDAGNPLPLSAVVRYTAGGETWGSGCVMAQVRVERDTGALTIDQLCWVDDAGKLITPALAHGQLWGGLAQGLGQASMERLVFDSSFQLLTGSLMDYALPRASDIPPVILDSIETHTAANPIGAKGVGEAGCIGIPAAILNATIDALRPLNCSQIDFPLTPSRLWQAMQPNE